MAARQVEVPRIILTQEKMDLKMTLRFGKENKLASNSEVHEPSMAFQLRGFFRTADILVAEDPGKGFGDEVRYSGMHFHIPEPFRGLQNAALLIRGPNYTVFEPSCGDPQVTMYLRVKYAGEIAVIPDYPKSTLGWHLPHEDTCIPQGENVPVTDRRTLRLIRNPGPYIGSVVRYGDYSLVYNARDIYLNRVPSARLQVAVIR